MMLMMIFYDDDDEEEGEDGNDNNDVDDDDGDDDDDEDDDDDSNGNTNSIWKVINRCLPKKASSQPQFIDSNGNVANSFNKYFTSVGRLTALKAN